MVKTIRLDPASVTDEQVARALAVRRQLLGFQDWELEPHQVAPEGDWFGWIMEAGQVFFPKPKRGADTAEILAGLRGNSKHNGV